MAGNEWPEVRIVCSPDSIVCNSFTVQESTVSYPMTKYILICLWLSLRVCNQCC